MLDDFIGWLQEGAASSVFLGIGIIFLIVLVIAFILDGIFEAFDIGDGPLSLTTLGAFGALFGFAGYASMGFGASTGLAAFIGAVIGLLGAVGAWGLSGIFKKASSTSSVSTASLAGEEASVTLRIPGGETPGEVSYNQHGMLHTYTAYSENPIPSGRQVRIVSIRGGGSVNVELLTETTDTVATPETTN